MSVKYSDRVLFFLVIKYAERHVNKFNRAYFIFLSSFYLSIEYSCEFVRLSRSLDNQIRLF